MSPAARSLENQIQAGNRAGWLGQPIFGTRNGSGHGLFRSGDAEWFFGVTRLGHIFGG
jgi:hypothetical protein